MTKVKSAAKKKSPAKKAPAKEVKGKGSRSKTGKKAQPRKPIEDFEPDFPTPAEDDDKILELVKIGEHFGWFVAAAQDDEGNLMGLVMGTEDYINAMLGPA